MDVVSNHSKTSQIPKSPTPITLAQAALYWLKLGFISFGGPAGQIAIMHHDLVEEKRWISEKRFLHALNYCMILPGPEAQQLATYIGWLLHRTWGGIIAGGLFVLPSFFILVGLAWVYMAYGSLPAVAGMLYGFKPAVVAIVLFAAYRIGSRVLRNPVTWSIAAAAFFMIFVFKLPFPTIVFAAGLIGFVGGNIFPQYFKPGGGHGSAQKEFGPALIDDDTPTPAHALFSWVKLARITAVGVVLWVAMISALTFRYGWDGTFPQIGWFFTKAALLTFGGAYAVLPYVYQGAVENYQWLSPIQMIDGLALGETTPGPLIMVVTFVGFVGGWTKEVFGPDALFASAFVASAIATFFTFLPSFIFILLGGPFIETTHGNLKLTAPLTAITAAVVGVIVNLALFFAYHVFWPSGLDQPVDWLPVLITAIALIALFRFKVGVIPIILSCGILGMASNLFH
ncbi:chromate efflux transporter [Nitrosospira sp. Nsp13]|uniref:chromate efflux transporter n=1 Tax=Nitrosospira sp. Nsp13 TaxID=1855332 RepID=UPI0008892C6D|nr:chromate efflux transporter [Nitrosospira sp. Nsp13]SCX81930.1 chromate transporter [Nitrosospira sp. Nsp13]